MKKLLSLCMLLCMVCTGAWAGYQVGSTPISTKDGLTDGIYALEIRTKTYTGWLNYADGNTPFRVTRSNVMSAFTAGERVVTNTKYLWKVTNEANGFSLQCVNNSVYIGNKGESSAYKGNVYKAGVTGVETSTSFVLSDPKADGSVMRFNVWKTQDGQDAQEGNKYPYLHTNDGTGEQILSYWPGGNMDNMNAGTAIKVAFYPVIEGDYDLPKLVENGIYEIKNVSNEGNGAGRGYLIDYTSWANGPTIGDCPWSDHTAKHPTTHNDGTTTSSYWYVYNNANGTVSIFSLSTLSGNDYPKFLNVPTGNTKSTWSDLPTNLIIESNTSKSGSYSIRNPNGTIYLSMGCGTPANQGATACDGMNDGGTQLSFVKVEESSLNEDQLYIKNYGIALIEGTAPAVRVSHNNKDHYFHINCDGDTSNYLNPFTFPTQTENQRGVFQFYRVDETAKVYIKETGSDKYLAYSNTGNGSMKITFTDQANASQFIVVNNTTYYNIGPSATTSLNWFGGVGVDPYRIGTDDVTNTIGFYSATNDNSKWRLNEVTGNAATTAINNSAAYYLATFKPKAKAYNEYIGASLGKYNFNNGKVTGYNDAVDACATAEELNNLINSIKINIPTTGKFYRFKGQTGRYINSDTTDKGTYDQGLYSMSTLTDENKDKTIFCLTDNNHLISYKTGMSFSWGWKSSMVGADHDCTWTISEAETIGKYMGKYTIECPESSAWSGQKYLGDVTNQAYLNRQDDKNANSAWTIEEVTELPITLSTIDNHCYGTMYSPMAINLSDLLGGLKAYAVEVNGDKAEMRSVGDVIPANTAVVLYANQFAPDAVTLGGTSSYDGINALEGTIATTNTIPDGGVMTMQNNSELGIGFYSFSGTALKGFKAYLPKSAGIKAFNFNFEEELTTAIVNAIAAQNAGAAYDLTGRKVRANVKGISIDNGKKVIR